ncbi:hypothetical protein BHE74_00015741, partial [Ensete ventricosum]
MAFSLRFAPTNLARARVFRCSSAAPAAVSARCSMAAPPLRVGVAQMTSTNDLEANYNTCSRLVKAAPPLPPSLYISILSSHLSLMWTSLAIWYTRRVMPQLLVVAAAQAGRHNEKRESYGDSLIIDPWGIVIARLPGDTQ